MARLYDLTGRESKAAAIRTVLEHKRSQNPYYAIAKANEALYQKDFDRAIKLFKKSIRLDRTLHESHFGLAKAYFSKSRKIWVGGKSFGIKVSTGVDSEQDCKQIEKRNRVIPGKFSDIPEGKKCCCFVQN